MAQQSERPSPHGDPLEDIVGANPEENRAQRDSDAPADATLEPGGLSDRANERGSDANGVPAFDEADGEKRKALYRDGAHITAFDSSWPSGHALPRSCCQSSTTSISL